MIKDKQVKVLSKYFTKPVFSEVDVKLMKRDLGKVCIGFSYKVKKYIIIADNASRINDHGLCVIIAVDDGLSASAFLGVSPLGKNFKTGALRTGDFTDDLAMVLIKQAEKHKDLEEIIKKSQWFKKVVTLLDDELQVRVKGESL